LDEELGAPGAPQSAANAAPAEKLCPLCDSPLPKGGRICLQCGCDAVAEQERAAKGLEAATSSNAKSPLSGSMRLLRGTAVSALGAIVGAVAWAMVALVTGLELRFIACAIGAATGAGMSTAYDDHSDGTLRGIIAAGMALVGIFLGKVLILVLLFAVLMSQLGGFDFEREVVAANMARKSLEKQGVDPESVDDALFQQELDAAKASLEVVDDEEIERRFNELMAEVEQENDVPEQTVEGDARLTPAAEQEALVELPVDEQQEPGEMSPVWLFFLLMFGPLDALFIIVAIATAYKMGSGLTTS
jgi:hypothetical protein